MADYLILFAIVLGVNLMPAFGPPTWPVIVMYGINTKMPVQMLVLVAASAAALKATASPIGDVLRLD